MQWTDDQDAGIFSVSEANGPTSSFPQYVRKIHKPNQWDDGFLGISHINRKSSRMHHAIYTYVLFCELLLLFYLNLYSRMLARIFRRTVSSRWNRPKGKKRADEMGIECLIRVDKKTRERLAGPDRSSVHLAVAPMLHSRSTCHDIPNLQSLSLALSNPWNFLDTVSLIHIQIECVSITVSAREL